MDFPHTGEINKGYFQKNHTLNIGNTAQRHDQNIYSNFIRVDELSTGTIGETQSDHGFLQLPEFINENIESNTDFLKVNVSAKIHQPPFTRSVKLSNFPHGHYRGIGNDPGDAVTKDTPAINAFPVNEEIYAEVDNVAQTNFNQASHGRQKHLDVVQTVYTNNVRQLV